MLFKEIGENYENAAEVNNIIHTVLNVNQQHNI